jgi:hypothetical protein
MVKSTRTRRLAALALALAALAPIGARGQEAAESKEDASASRAITGRVLAGDQPVANARVFVREAGSGGGAAPRTFRTDSEGRFTAPDLAPRPYRVWADAPAFVMPEDAPGTVGAVTYYWPGSAVTISLVKGGVITGRVTTADGEPIVMLPVRAVRATEKGRPVRPSRDNVLTDDRGVYRIFGLRPGDYRVVAGGISSGFFGMVQGFPQEEEVQTYYPSSTYDTASLVHIAQGDEIAGVDIRYRGLKGHAVSGTLDGALPEGNAGAYVGLFRADGGQESSTLTLGVSQYRGFALYGVADGQYDLVAQVWGQKGLTAMSKPLHVTVRGSDVTGLKLVVEALGSIEGKVALEPLAADPRPTECPKAGGGSVSEVALVWRRDERDPGAGALLGDPSSDSAPGADGAFSVEELRAGLYRVEPKAPGDGWYVKSVLGPKPASGGAAPDVGSSGVALSAGQKASGLVVTLAEGAGSVAGRVVAAAEGQALPAGARVYLVPTAPADAESVLRYAEAAVESDGRFEVRNLAPGRYRAVARALDGPADRPAAWDRAERAKLRAEAEAAGQEVEVGACRRAADVVVRIAPAARARPK